MHVESFSLWRLKAQRVARIGGGGAIEFAERRTECRKIDIRKAGFRRPCFDLRDLQKRVKGADDPFQFCLGFVEQVLRVCVQTIPI